MIERLSCLALSGNVSIASVYRRFLNDCVERDGFKSALRIFIRKFSGATGSLFFYAAVI